MSAQNVETFRVVEVEKGVPFEVDEVAPEGKCVRRVSDRNFQNIPVQRRVSSENSRH